MAFGQHCEFWRRVAPWPCSNQKRSQREPRRRWLLARSHSLLRFFAHPLCCPGSLSIRSVLWPRGDAGGQWNIGFWRPANPLTPLSPRLTCTTQLGSPSSSMLSRATIAPSSTMGRQVRESLTRWWGRAQPLSTTWRCRGVKLRSTGGSSRVSVRSSSRTHRLDALRILLSRCVLLRLMSAPCAVSTQP